MVLAFNPQIYHVHSRKIVVDWLNAIKSHQSQHSYNTTHKHTEYNTCRLHAGQDKQIQTSVDFLVKFIYLGVTQIHVSTSVQHFSETSKATRIPAETDIIFQPSKIKCCWSNTINSEAFFTLKLFKEYEHRTKRCMFISCNNNWNHKREN